MISRKPVKEEISKIMLHETDVKKGENSVLSKSADLVKEDVYGNFRTVLVHLGCYNKIPQIR